MRPGHTINSTRALSCMGDRCRCGAIRAPRCRRRWSCCRRTDRQTPAQPLGRCPHRGFPAERGVVRSRQQSGRSDHARGRRNVGHRRSRSTDHRRSLRRPQSRSSPSSSPSSLPVSVEASARAQPPHSRSRADAVTTATAADTPSLSPNRWRRPPRPRRTLPLAVPLPAVPARSRMLASRLIDSRETSRDRPGRGRIRASGSAAVCGLRLRPDKNLGAPPPGTDRDSLDHHLAGRILHPVGQRLDHCTSDAALRWRPECDCCSCSRDADDAPIHVGCRAERGSGSSRQ